MLASADVTARVRIKGVDVATAVADNAAARAFVAAASSHNLVPVYIRLTADQLTPVTAYRCLVGDTDFESPSFLFESVQNGTDSGRFSFVGAHPALEVLAQGTTVTILNHELVRPGSCFTIL